MENGGEIVARQKIRRQNSLECDILVIAIESPLTVFGANTFYEIRSLLYTLSGCYIYCNPTYFFYQGGETPWRLYA